MTESTDPEPDGTADDPTPASHTTDDWKVLGTTDTTTGVGVLGHNTSGSGVSTGVQGVVDSTNVEAGGVRGIATTGRGVAVHADSTSGNGHAIRAKSNSGTGWGYGIWATNFASSGQYATGIYAETKAPNSTAVIAENDGGGEALRARGWVGIDDLGAEAHQVTDIDVPGTNTTVVYDDQIVDDRNEYDPTTGEFTCANPGTYQVEAQIEWPSTIPEETGLFVEIHVNGSPDIRNYQEVERANSAGPTQGISKTIRGLSAGDVITIVADHSDGTTTHSLTGIGTYAQLQITQLG